MTTFQIQVSTAGQVIFRTESDANPMRVRANATLFATAWPLAHVHVIKSSVRTDVLSTTADEFFRQYPEAV